MCWSNEEGLGFSSKYSILMSVRRACLLLVTRYALAWRGPLMSAEMFLFSTRRYHLFLTRRQSKSQFHYTEKEHVARSGQMEGPKVGCLSAVCILQREIENSDCLTKPYYSTLLLQQSLSSSTYCRPAWEVDRVLCRLFCASCPFAALVRYRLQRPSPTAIPTLLTANTKNSTTTDQIILWDHSILYSRQHI